MLIYKYNGFGELSLEKRRGGITPRLTHTPSLPKPLTGIPVVGLFFYAPKTPKT